MESQFLGRIFGIFLKNLADFIDLFSQYLLIFLNTWIIIERPRLFYYIYINNFFVRMRAARATGFV